MRKFFLPILALVGLSAALWTWRQDQNPPPALEPLAPPAPSPFASYISAAGLVESSTANIAVATPSSGIVREVLVIPGQRVSAGQPLFRLDDADLRAALARQQLEVELATQRLHKLELGPRPEEVASQQAQVQQATVALDDARRQLQLRRQVADPRAISAEELLQQEVSVRAREQQLLLARKQLELLAAGAWQPDLAIARTDLAQAQRQLFQTQLELDRLTVRAPISGEVLQLNIHKGEMAASTPNSPPPVVLGQTNKLHIRAEVDENDAWRVDPSRPAVAFLRARRDISTSLRFVRLEPYVIPKKNLTGESAERVDTRVLPVIYELQSPALRLFVGQQLDVFIDAPPAHLPATTTPASRTEQGS